jgi:hypothetical protein
MWFSEEGQLREATPRSSRAELLNAHKRTKGDRERWPVATHLTILQLILASDMNRQQLLPPPKLLFLSHQLQIGIKPEKNIQLKLRAG